MSKRLVFVIIPVIIIAALLGLIILASGGDDDKDSPATQVEATEQVPTATPAPAATTPPTAPAEAESSGGGEPVAAASDAPRVLAWQRAENGSGRLLQVQQDAMPQELFVSSGGRVQRCGHDYRLSGANGVILFAGAERGDLVYYPLDGGAPVALGQTGRMTCAGPDTLQVFPGGEQIAYLRFDDSTREYRTGALIVTDMQQNTRDVLDSATAFQITGSGLVALSFYPDGEGHAAEADVDIWSPEGKQNVTTLEPQRPADSDAAVCGFTAGAIAQHGESIFVLLGQQCQPGGTLWRLVSLTNGVPTEIASGEPGGSFYPDNFTAQVFPALDGSGALVAIPSGLQRHIVQLVWVGLDGSLNPVADFALADRLGEADLEGRQMLRSPDGRWLAVVEVTRSGTPSLWLLDLENPAQPPQEVITLGTNEQIIDYQWGPGGRLYFIYGGEVNALSVVVPGSDPVRIVRGQFTALAPDSQGERVAVAELVPDPQASDQTIGQIVLVDLDGTITPLWQATDSTDQVIPLGLE